MMGNERRNLPYPCMDGAIPDRETAELLRELYAGKNSELTAVSEYLYQAIRTEREYPHLSQALEQIGVMEMRHFKLLGELLLQMGEDPRFYAAVSRGERGDPRRKTPRWWNGYDVAYSDQPQRFLQEDIRGEQRAIRNYQEAICRIRDETVRNVLRRIAIDEESHIRTLEQLLAENAEDC